MSGEAELVGVDTEHFQEALDAVEAAGARLTVLRETQPNFYRAITIFALISIGLGLNFIFLHPAFNQYHLSRIMAVVFVAVGVAELVFLNVAVGLRWLRVTMAIGVSSYFFYAGALTTFFFQTHKTSLQLPITYCGLSVLLLIRLVAPSRPNLYRVTPHALISIGLGLDFFFLTFPFDQYHLKKIMAVVLVMVGVAELIFLYVPRMLRWLWLTMATGVSVFFFYGGALTTFFFQTHKTSLQLPITYFGLSVLLLALLIEPTIPLIKNNGNGRRLR